HTPSIRVGVGHVAVDSRRRRIAILPDANCKRIPLGAFGSVGWIDVVIEQSIEGYAVVQVVADNRVPDRVCALHLNVSPLAVARRIRLRYPLDGCVTRAYVI